MTRKPERNILVYIKQLKRPIFTTHELISLSGKSASAVTQALNYLVKQGLLIKVYRGVWVEADQKISPYSLAPFLKPKNRVYVSFLSALHLHGIVEQIPQVITLASTAHSASLRTALGVFHLHRIAPDFFAGFDWYRGEGNFLIAEPEKALVDCLYLSAHKKRQYGFFPELRLVGALNFTKVNDWVKRIPSPRIRLVVKKKLEGIKQQNKG
ncbi:MAG: type IV toxin-antitoxin system AbiEi family antitoxin domain-containing protein [Deltaproteobacteria bacterium]|nr:type IV toxin-antitoxin system AbiEi family antitoxin domain-containing protein [Deltaproteobacteria bacterium]